MHTHQENPTHQGPSSPSLSLLPFVPRRFFSFGNFSDSAWFAVWWLWCKGAHPVAITVAMCLPWTVPAYCAGHAKAVAEARRKAAEKPQVITLSDALSPKQKLIVAGVEAVLIHSGDRP